MILAFPRVDFTIKWEIMKLKKLSVLTIYSLIWKYESKFNEYFSIREISIFLISLCKRLFRKWIIYEIKERNKNKRRKFIKYEVIKRKMEDNNKIIKNILNQKFNNLDENLFINEVINY